MTRPYSVAFKQKMVRPGLRTASRPLGGSAFSDRLSRHLCQPGFSSKDKCRNSTNSRFVRIGQ